MAGQFFLSDDEEERINLAKNKANDEEIHDVVNEYDINDPEDPEELNFDIE